MDKALDVRAFVRRNDAWLRRRIARKLGPRGGELDDVLQLTYVQLRRAAGRIGSENEARQCCVVAANIARRNAGARTAVPVEEVPSEASGLAPDPADGS